MNSGTETEFFQITEGSIQTETRMGSPSPNSERHHRLEAGDLDPFAASRRRTADHVIDADHVVACGFEPHTVFFAGMTWVMVAWAIIYEDLRVALVRQRVPQQPRVMRPAPAGP